jgi:hypothetical protein
MTTAKVPVVQQPAGIQLLTARDTVNPELIGLARPGNLCLAREYRQMFQ